VPGSRQLSQWRTNSVQWHRNVFDWLGKHLKGAQ
jgi:hypothetical protein